jgi:hypothetical protein
MSEALSVLVMENWKSIKIIIFGWAKKSLSLYSNYSLKFQLFSEYNNDVIST